MSYKRIEHTADIEFEVSADSLEQLFNEALEAMVETMLPQVREGVPKTSLMIHSISSDPTGLLIDFLSQILAQSEINNSKYKLLKFIKFSPVGLEVELEGSMVSGFGEDIKAVTFADANVRKDTDGKWKTKLVFDV